MSQENLDDGLEMPDNNNKEEGDELEELGGWKEDDDEEDGAEKKDPDVEYIKTKIFGEPSDDYTI